jgi:hypothetical protein
MRRVAETFVETLWHEPTQERDGHVERHVERERR